MSDSVQLGIPKYWKECRSKSGQKYYFNTLSGQSIWEKPLARIKENKCAQRGSDSGKIIQPDFKKKPHQSTDSPNSNVDDSSNSNVIDSSKSNIDNMDRQRFKQNTRGAPGWQHRPPYHQANNFQHNQWNKAPFSQGARWRNSSPRSHNNSYQTNSHHPRNNYATYQTNHHHPSSNFIPSHSPLQRQANNLFPRKHQSGFDQSRPRVYEDINRDKPRPIFRRSASVGPSTSCQNQCSQRGLSLEQLKKDNQRDFQRVAPYCVRAINPKVQTNVIEGTKSSDTMNPNEACKRKIVSDEIPVNMKRPRVLNQETSSTSDTDVSPPAMISGSFPPVPYCPSDNHHNDRLLDKSDGTKQSSNLIESNNCRVSNEFDNSFERRNQFNQDKHGWRHRKERSRPYSTTINSTMTRTSSSPMARTSSSPMTRTSSSPMAGTSSSPMARTSSSLIDKTSENVPSRSPVMSNSESVKSRTLAQDRMLRLKSKLSIQSTPVSIQREQTPQTWPCDNRQTSTKSAVLSSYSNRRGEMPQNPSPNQCKSPSSQTSLPAQNSQMSVSSEPRSPQRSSLCFTESQNSSSSPLSRSLSNSEVFAHPSQTWSSPVQRARSNSVSSNMSVDSTSTFSFTSHLQMLNKKSQDCLSREPACDNPVRACDGTLSHDSELAYPSISGNRVSTTRRSESQESMEWEPIPTAVIVEKVVEVRQQITPRTGGIVVPPGTSDITESTSINNKILCLVVDTNVFLSALEFLSRVRDHYTEEFGYPILYIPWQVVQELDSIKDRCSGNRPLLLRVTEAIRFIQTNLRSAHPRIKFQDQQSERESEKVLEHSSPDDKILAGGLYIAQKLKAIPNAETHVLLISEDVNLRNKALINCLQSLAVSEIEEIVFSGAMLLPRMTVRSEGDKRSLNLMNDLFCKIKSRLFTFMSELLTEAMKLKASPHHAWEQYVDLKPPWDWKKIFLNYKQHLISFSDLITTDIRRLNPTIIALKTVILKHETDSAATLDNIRTLLRESAAFIRVVKDDTLRANMNSDVRAFQVLLTKLVGKMNGSVSSAASNPSIGNASTLSVVVKEEKFDPFIISSERLTSSNRSSSDKASRPNTGSSSSVACDSSNVSTTYSENSATPSSSGTLDDASEKSATATPLSSSPVTPNIPAYSSVSVNNSSMACDVAKQKVFCSLESLYRNLNSFRFAVSKFIKFQTVEDLSLVPDISLDQVVSFTDWMLLSCTLKVCLETIFSSSNNAEDLNKQRIPLNKLLALLPSEFSVTYEELLLALQDKQFYTQLEGGVQEFYDLNKEYELMIPAVKNFLRINT